MGQARGALAPAAQAAHLSWQPTWLLRKRSGNWRMLQRGPTREGKTCAEAWLPTPASPSAVAPTPCSGSHGRQEAFRSLPFPTRPVKWNHTARGLTKRQSQKTESCLKYQRFFYKTLLLWLTTTFLLGTYSNLAEIKIHISHFLSGNA